MKLARPLAAAGATLAALAVCTVSALWITRGVSPWEGDQANLWHHYEYLADGFLHGHTYLSVRPAPQLAQLADPFDPAANAPYRLWDASLYAGKYYLYYGPTPALVLMAPWEALTGHILPQRTAVALFASLGTAFLGLIFWEMRRRHFPQLSPLALFGAIVVAFHASWLPVTLRRPGVWELPIVSADACLWAALYFLWKFHDSGGRLRWGAATGIALSLLMGSRVTQLFAAGVIVLMLFVPASPLSDRNQGRRGALLALLLVTAGGLALLAYNHARFGRWLEFGQSYQLWGMDERRVRHFDPSFIAFNARLYLTSIPDLSPYFPFLRGCWPERLPQGYIATEEIQGILFVMPVQLAGLAAWAWAWKQRPRWGAASMALVGATGASALAAAVLFCWAGACSRYLTELLGGWTLLTSFGLMVIFAPESRAPRSLRVLALAASLWTVMGVWLASIEFRGFMRQTEPRTYAALARVGDAPSEWRIRSKGILFGPVDLEIRVPRMPCPQTVLLAAGRPQMLNQLILAPVNERHVALILAENEHITLRTPPLPVRAGVLRVRLEAPWLYPPAAHPYWDRVADPLVRRELQTRFALQSSAGNASTHSDFSFDPIDLVPVVRSRGDGDANSPYVVSAETRVGP